MNSISNFSAFDFIYSNRSLAGDISHERRAGKFEPETGGSVRRRRAGAPESEATPHFAGDGRFAFDDTGRFVAAAGPPAAQIVDASVGSLRAGTLGLADHLGPVAGQIVDAFGAAALEQPDQRGRALPPSPPPPPVRALPAVQLPVPLVQHGGH